MTHSPEQEGLTVSDQREEFSIQRDTNKRVRKRREANRKAVAIERAIAAPRRNDLLPKLQLEYLRTDAIVPPKRRIRKSDDGHVAKITRSIATLGQVDPILIDASNNLIDGESRLKAAKLLSLEQVACIRVDHLSEIELRVLRVTLNKTQEGGKFNLGETNLEFQDFLAHGIDLTITGFETAEIDNVLAIGSEAIEEAIPDSDDNERVPISRLGDGIQMGGHRLFCGSATSAVSYEQLLDGEKVRLVNTDPPYWLTITDVLTRNADHNHQDFAGQFGKMTEAQYEAFVEAALAAIHPNVLDGGLGFFFGDWRSMRSYLNAAASNQLELLNIITWDKGRGGMGSLYRGASEFAVLLKFGQAPHCNQVQLGRHGRDRTTVWAYPGATQMGSSARKMLAEHPTPKSVEMIADSILDVTERGDAVLDPFCGSGSAIIAGERTGRRVFGLELEPKFIDLIVRRWERYSGKTAIHIQTGLSFAELAEQRSQEATQSNSGALPSKGNANEDLKEEST